METEGLPAFFGPRARLRATARILAVALCALTLAGCSRVEIRTEPIEAGELERMAGVIAGHWGDPESVRAMGTGRLSTSNSMTRFSFAMLYDDCSWVRMDVRPTAVITGPIGNVHVQLDGTCSEAYLPNVPLWIRGCLGEEDSGLDEIDLPALMLGFLTPRTLLSISNPEVGGSKGLTVVRGFLGERRVFFALTDDLRELRHAKIADPKGNYEIQIEYAGHGWKSEIPAPETTTLAYDSGDTRPQELRLLFTRLRRGTSVDRLAHKIAVPLGLRSVGWDELELWR